ncbi:putative L-asparaginase [Candidatus Hepatincola sp. Av]
MAEKNIVVLATGATPTFLAKLTSQPLGYIPAKTSFNQVLQSIPEMQRIANVTGEEINLSTNQDLNSKTLLTLAHRVQELIDSSKIDGIIITYDGENLGAIAYFFNLVIHTTKPIIIIQVGKSNIAINSYQDSNLYQGVLVATSTESRNREVLVVVNNKIFSARDVIKSDTLLVRTFAHDKRGNNVGYINNSKVIYLKPSIRLHTVQSEFNIKDINELPLVDILYGYAEANPSYMEYANNMEVKGIVYAGISGNGNLYFSVINSLQHVQQKGMLVVRSSRVSSRVIVHANEIDNNSNSFVASGSLSPQESRILLMLGLTKSSNAKYIQDLFDKY